MPRITGGSARGRIIHVPRGEVRPATAKMRSALFDILAGILPGARVLDLYAGSGGLGFEALSRGASTALFVDCSRQSLEVARQNAELLGYINNCRFLASDVFAYLASSGRSATSAQFDLVFAAPPYRIAEPSRILAAMGASGLLIPQAVVCLEYDRHTPEAQAEGAKFTLYRRKRFGETVLDVWDYAPD